MNDALRTIAALAAEQHEVVSRAQILAHGVSRSALQRHVAGGLLVAVGAHTFRFAGTALTWRGHLHAGLLDLGRDALVAGRSAAALHGLDGFEPGSLEFVVPRGQRRRRTVGVVRSCPPVPPLDRSQVDGLAVTGPAFTVVQLGAHGSERQVANAVDSAVRLGLITPDVVQRRLGVHRYPNMAGGRLLDAVLADAGVQSHLERQFLRLVRQAGLPTPALQRVHRRGSRLVARVDFDFAPLPVVVEVGGQLGYLTRTERQRQERRRSELQLLGRIVYFFTYEDITGDPSYVVGTLRSALEAVA
jgi:AbiEi antitoxin C-terminal domain